VFNVMKKTPLWLHKIRVWFDLGPTYNWFILNYDSLFKSHTCAFVYTSKMIE